jgi:hypothetical protein
MAREDSRYYANLAQMIDARFDLEELAHLAFSMGIEWEHLAGNVRPNKIKSLIEYAKRHGELPDLIGQLRRERPDEYWPDPPDQLDPPEQIGEVPRSYTWLIVIVAIFSLGVAGLLLANWIRSQEPAPDPPNETVTKIASIPLLTSPAQEPALTNTPSPPPTTTPTDTPQPTDADTAFQAALIGTWQCIEECPPFIKNGPLQIFYDNLEFQDDGEVQICMRFVNTIFGSEENSCIPVFGQYEVEDSKISISSPNEQGEMTKVGEYQAQVEEGQALILTDLRDQTWFYEWD